jgi:hypothetical protein
MCSNATMQDVLAELALQPAELLALQRQGYVASENRPKGTIYKLRFRMARKQRVRCLGADSDRAKQVCDVLAILQMRRRWRRRLAQRALQQRTLWRRIRADLTEHELTGFRLHGRQLRRARASKPRAPEFVFCDFHFTSEFHRGTKMIAKNNSILDDAAGGPAMDLPANRDELSRRRKQILFAVLDECTSQLTALEGALGLASADLQFLLGCYREDLEELRTELSSARERLEELHRVSEQMYKLAKQIDSFAKTSLLVAQQRQRMTQSAGSGTGRLGSAES